MIKVLSLKQPWLELILQKRKTIETRVWNTKFRGEFYLHASKNVDVNACRKFGFNPKAMKTGKVLGRAWLFGVKEYSSKNEFLRDYNKHLVDKSDYNKYLMSKFNKKTYGFLLKDVKRINPIDAKGNLGFWKLSVENRI